MQRLLCAMAWHRGIVLQISNSETAELGQRMVTSGCSGAARDILRQQQVATPAASAMMPGSELETSWM